MAQQEYSADGLRHHVETLHGELARLTRMYDQPSLVDVHTRDYQRGAADAYRNVTRKLSLLLGWAEGAA